VIADVDAAFAFAMVAVAIAIVRAIGHAVVAIPALASRAVAVLFDQTSTRQAGDY